MEYSDVINGDASSTATLVPQVGSGTRSCVMPLLLLKKRPREDRQASQVPPLLVPISGFQAVRYVPEDVGAATELSGGYHIGSPEYALATPDTAADWAEPDGLNDSDSSAPNGPFIISPRRDTRISTAAERNIAGDKSLQTRRTRHDAHLTSITWKIGGEQQLDLVLLVLGRWGESFRRSEVGNAGRATHARHRLLGSRLPKKDWAWRGNARGGDSDGELSC